MPDANSLDLTTGMTLEAWVRPTALGACQTALLKETTGDLSYALYASSRVRRLRRRAAVRVDRRRPTSGATDGAARPNAWSHLAATYDGAVVAALRQRHAGRVEGARPARSRRPTGALRIGGNSIWGEYFNGQIDEVRVYNRALSAPRSPRTATPPISAAAPTRPRRIRRAPTVSVTAPAREHRVGDGRAWRRPRRDNVGVVGVQFKLDGANLGSEDTTVAVFGVTWNTTTATNGSHALTAVARDAAGNTATSTAVDVTVAELDAGHDGASTSR